MTLADELGDRPILRQAGRDADDEFGSHSGGQLLESVERWAAAAAFVFTACSSTGSGAGPQTPACGTAEVTTSELISGVQFPAGRYQINAVGISCEEVMGDAGLFNKFLQLEDTDELPEPWSYLEGAVGAPKFVTGPGVGFRVERLAD